MVVVVITGILAAMAVPSFQRAIEQARVDQAAATLRAIWAAQRFYKLDDPQGAYAPNLQTLKDAKLIDAIDTAAFTFEVAANGFPVQAERRPSTWSGALAINEDGQISGQVVGHGHTITPAFAFEDDGE
jgi:Tfp pilus assembly protein PilE